MTATDPERALAEFEHRLDRSAFGRATRTSYRLESAQEDAALRAATNLLTKAARRLDAGDERAAAELARRALALSPARPAEGSPGALAASLLLFEALTVRLEGADDAEVEVEPLLALRETLPAPVAVELERGLDSLVALGAPPALERRIRAAIPAGRRVDEPLGGVADPGERVRVVLDLLRLAARVRQG